MVHGALCIVQKIYILFSISNKIITFSVSRLFINEGYVF